MLLATLQQKNLAIPNLAEFLACGQSRGHASRVQFLDLNTGPLIVLAVGKMASKIPLLTLAKTLVLIGGIVLVIGGILQAIDFRGPMDFGTNLARLGSLTGIVIGILIGILALIGSKEVANPAWSLILLILGLFVGSLGGILVFIGGLIGLIAHYVKV